MILQSLTFSSLEHTGHLFCSAQLLSRVHLFATPWTVARQAPLSMAFSRQEYWSRLPFPTPGDLDPGTKPVSLISPALAGEFFSTSATWEACVLIYVYNL